MVTDPDSYATQILVDVGWQRAPSPAVLVGDDGRVLGANEAARRLFPLLDLGAPFEGCVPSWLGEAGRAARPADETRPSGVVDGHAFEGRPVRYPDGGPTMWWLTEVTDLREAEKRLGLEQERTAFLRSASDALLSSLNVTRTMEVAAEFAAERLADAAWVVAPSARGRHPAALSLRGESPRSVTLQIRPEDLPGLAEALQGFPPMPSRWIDAASAPAWVVPEGFGPIGSVAVTSLPGHGVPAGALVLLRRAEKLGFTEDEEAVARLFAARVGAALAAGRLFEEQRSITDVLTAQLLPPVLQRVDGVDFAGIYRPAQDASRLGGDFYDVHALEGGGALALLGDVCGQGLEAAVLSGKIRTTMQALLPMADDHARILTLLNSSLLSSRETRFATLVLASADWEEGHVRLRLTRAGHLPSLIIRADGRIEEIRGRGSLVGVLPAMDVTTETVLLAPGEVCLLHTDGIIEARGGPLGEEMFGETRLHRALSECTGLPAAAVVERVLMLATEWIGGAKHDDMAALVIAAPRQPRAAAPR
jgi:serine phosphatase RsbU (regulator of sigma subunit)